MTRTLLRLAELAVTPLVPADYLDLLDPLRAGASLRARVLAVHPETRDAVTLVLKPGRGWRGHVPGQWVRVGVDVDGVRHWRAYSVTSAPGAPVSITVKAIPDGVVSSHLVRRARPGMLLQLDQATGDFVLPSSCPPAGAAGAAGANSARNSPSRALSHANSPRNSGDEPKLLFVTAGSGITPVMGMLRSHDLADVVVVHSAPTADDVIFGGELRALARRGELRLVELHTDTDGMLDPADLATLVPDLDERLPYACGPTGLVHAVQDLLPDVRTELFRPTVVEPGDGGAVSFTKSERVVAVDGATTILDAGEAAGVLMPSGCRMGICFGCVLPLKDGAVRDLRNGTVTTAGDGVLVQTCVSAAAGPCDLEI